MDIKPKKVHLNFFKEIIKLESFIIYNFIILLIKIIFSILFIYSVKIFNKVNK